MLDKPDQEPRGASFDPDAGIGEMLGQIVTDAKQMAEAEIAYAKAQAKYEVFRFRVPALLAAIAFGFATAALVAFAVGITLTLSDLIGHFAGGLATTVLFLAIAGLLLLIAKGKLERPQ